MIAKDEHFAEALIKSLFRSKMKDLGGFGKKVGFML